MSRDSTIASLIHSLPWSMNAVPLMKSTLRENDGKSLTEYIEQYGIADYRPPFQYDLGARLGTGGLSNGVFLTTTATDRYAVKCIKLASLKNPSKDIPEIVQEFRMILELNKYPHKNVAQYYYLDIVLYEGSPEIRILMEYCEGQTLTERNKLYEKAGQRCSQSEIIDDVTGILNGLVYLHRNRIAHRDIKGDNILLTADGTPKIVDFGLSMRLQASVTAVSEIPHGGGTAAYMAPENHDHTLGHIGRKSDVWSLGRVVLELLDGHPPHYYIQQSNGEFIRAVRTPEILQALMARNVPISFSRDGCQDHHKFLLAVRHFLTRCLEPVVARRANTEQLIGHPLITNNWRKKRGIWKKMKTAAQSVSLDDVKRVALGAGVLATLIGKAAMTTAARAFVAAVLDSDDVDYWAGDDNDRDASLDDDDNEDNDEDEPNDDYIDSGDEPGDDDEDIDEKDENNDEL